MAMAPLCVAAVFRSPRPFMGEGLGERDTPVVYSPGRKRPLPSAKLRPWPTPVRSAAQYLAAASLLG